MKLTRERIVIVLLILAVLFSLSYLAVVAYNYDAYYWSARDALLSGSNTRVDSLTLTKDQSTGTLAIKILASATNPTGYSGLTLERFEIVLYFDHAGNYSQSVFYTPSQNLLSNITPDLPLGPQSTVTGNLTIQLDQTQTNAFETFNQTYPSGIYAHTVLTVQISSFLDPVFGAMNPSVIQEIPIS